MFRSRFSEILPSKLPHFGPQDIERGVVDLHPSTQVEQLLCALLALVLNRKKPVEYVHIISHCLCFETFKRPEGYMKCARPFWLTTVNRRGHHGRALEEAVLSQRTQWPRKWNNTNPLHGGKSFDNMSPVERVSNCTYQYPNCGLTSFQLNLLRTLVMWALEKSEAIQTMLKDKYKQQRHNDDENQPLSVQSWGVDGDKRRYFLVQGQDDTSFRVYREGSRYTKNAHWYSVAGEIEEAKTLAKKLEEVDGSQAARRLAGRITNAIPMFEATEEVSLANGHYLDWSTLLMLTRRNVVAVSIAKSVVLHSVARSQASRSTKAARVANGLAILSMMMTTSNQMPLPTADRLGTPLVIHPSSLVRPSQQVAVKAGSRGQATTARAYSAARFLVLMSWHRGTVM